METKIYTKEGKEAGSINLPDALFALEWNGDLVHQVVTGMQSNERAPVAHTKDRSEVSGSNQKPWRQKGTGRARHGQRISPIWRGGGIAHGPRNEKDFSKKINKKMKTKALFTVLSQKLKDNEVIFVDDIATSEPKTKDAKDILKGIASANESYNALATKRKNAALVLLPGHDEATAKSFRNFSNVEVDEVRNVNPVKLLTYKYVVVAKPDEAVKILEGRATTNKPSNA